MFIPIFHRLLSSWQLDCLPAAGGGWEAASGKGSPAGGDPVAGSSKVDGILEYTRVFMEFYGIIWNLWNTPAFHRSRMDLYGMLKHSIEFHIIP